MSHVAAAETQPESIPVFVYGTLRQGECRFGLDTLLSVLHDEAYLEGFDMLNFGGAWPGLISGAGRIRGEVHLFSTLDQLDGIEGFSESDPEGSLFTRQEVSVSGADGEQLQATVYIFNDASKTARAQHKHIESGDWLDTGEGE